MPFQVHALNFWIEPLQRPAPDGGTFLIVWPEPNGEGRGTHNAHPDRTVMQTRAGEILVNRGERFRVRAVKIYRSAPVLDERETYWCRSVDDAIWDADQTLAPRDCSTFAGLPAS